MACERERGGFLQSILTIGLKKNQSQPLDKEVIFLGGKKKFQVKSQPLD